MVAVMGVVELEEALETFLAVVVLTAPGAMDQEEAFHPIFLLVPCLVVVASATVGVMDQGADIWRERQVIQV